MYLSLQKYNHIILHVLLFHDPSFTQKLTLSAPSSSSGCTYIHPELKDVEYFPARDFCLGAKGSKELSKEY